MGSGHVQDWHGVLPSFPHALHAAGHRLGCGCCCCACPEIPVRAAENEPIGRPLRPARVPSLAWPNLRPASHTRHGVVFLPVAALTRSPDRSTSQQLAHWPLSLLAPRREPPSHLQPSNKASAAPPFAAASTLRQTTKRAAVETAPSLSASAYRLLGRSFPTPCACGGYI